MKNYVFDDWHLVADLLDEQARHHWALLMKIQTKNGWRPYRLCVLGTHRRKRSFYLYWNSDSKRLARGPDQRRLARELPNVFNKLLEYLVSTKAMPTTNVVVC